MLISVLCPVLNEENNLPILLDFFLNAKPSSKELFLIDGGSQDATKEIIRDYTQRHASIHLINNPKKYVPFALNKAIPKCQGKYIIRIDAHCTYETDYFEKIIETFERTGADIVGGPTGTIGVSPFQQAVAYNISSKFGIGDSKVHQLDYEGYSDSVTFGAWRRELFQSVGLFDTRFLRNQDDEFHYRAKAQRKTIYQNPEIKLYYYPRSKAVDLFSQYFQYGVYKPLVLWKIPTETKLRHLVPAIFVLYLLSIPIGLQYSMLYFWPLLIYGILVFWNSFRSNKLSLKAKFWSLVVLPIIHIGYGSGFLLGLFKPLAQILQKKSPLKSELD